MSLWVTFQQLNHSPWLLREDKQDVETVSVFYRDLGYCTLPEGIYKLALPLSLWLALTGTFHQYYSDRFHVDFLHCVHNGIWRSLVSAMAHPLNQGIATYCFKMLFSTWKILCIYIFVYLYLQPFVWHSEWPGPFDVEPVQFYEIISYAYSLYELYTINRTYRSMPYICCVWGNDVCFEINLTCLSSRFRETIHHFFLIRVWYRSVLCLDPRS